MKKFTSILLVVSLSIIHAQAGGHHLHTCTTPAAQETNFRNTLWYNSNNRAGLAFRPLETYNYLDLDYQLESGKFRPQTVGALSHDISLNTEGAVWLGKFLIWGDFSFRNIFEKKARYNTALYEVSDEMPYFIMDDQVSNWNKQEYELSASLTSPVIADRIALALGVNYLTKVGAKQKDPRSETYKYDIELVPSLAINLGKNHFLGIHGLFDYGFERSKPSLNNYAISQEVIYNKGLGEGIIGVVGGNGGVKTLYYKGMEYGAGLQYSWSTDVDLLLDLSWIGKKTDAYENPNLPYRLGSTGGNELEADFQLIFGQNKSNKFNLDAGFRSLKGMEYVQKKNEEAFNQRWEVIKINDMSQIQGVDASLSYDHLFGNDPERGYDWKVGGNFGYHSTALTYRYPKSTYSAMNGIFSVNGAKQFKFNTSTLLLELAFGYNLNFSGAYLYGGNKKESVQVGYYTLENAYLNRDFLKTAARIAWTYTARKVNWFVDLKADWNKPLEIQEDRLLCNLSVGIVF